MHDNKELIEALGTVVTEILLAHEEGFYDDGLEHAATITKAMQVLSAQPSPDAAQGGDDNYEPPKHIFVLLRPGMVPRIGKPMGDPADSLRLWMKDNPECDFIVLTSHDPDTYAESGKEFLAIDRAFKQMEVEELPAAQGSEHGGEVPQELVEQWWREAVRSTAIPVDGKAAFIAQRAIEWDRQNRAAQPVQKPVATLHDDGRWTWKGPEPYESRFAGWRLDVYDAPQPVQKPIAATRAQRGGMMFGLLKMIEDLQRGEQTEQAQLDIRLLQRVVATLDPSSPQPLQGGAESVADEGMVSVPRAAVIFALGCLDGRMQALKGNDQYVSDYKLATNSSEALHNALSHSSKGDEHVPQTTR